MTATTPEPSISEKAGPLFLSVTSPHPMNPHFNIFIIECKDTNKIRIKNEELRIILYLCTIKSKKAMENRLQSEDIVMKVRSGRSVTAASFRMYTSHFRKMLKAEWIHIIDTAAVTTAVGMLVVYGLYFFIPLAALAVVLELVLWLMTAHWLTKLPVRALFRPAKRHWLLLIGVIIAGGLLLLPACAVVSLPLCVLIMAEWQSQSSAMLGDAQGMPTYIPYLMGVVWFITVCLQLLIRLLIVYLCYFAWGSAETKQREREQQKLNIQ